MNNNEIITIKFNDIEFDIDLIDNLLMIDPDIFDQFMDKRKVNGEHFKYSKKMFDKMPLINFLKKLTSLHYKKLIINDLENVNNSIIN